MSEKYWIAFGDVHEHLANIHRIKELAGAAGVIVSGDLTNVGDQSRAARIVDAVRSINSRVYAQIGNMDTREVERYLEQAGINIHNRLIRLDRHVHLMGIGYSTPTPFSTPSEVDESQVRSWLKSLAPQAGEAENLIFVTHTPPLGTRADLLRSGTNAGSRAVRNFIETVQPGVCVTGHIHEARSVDHIGNTVVINPGTLASGGYAEISFDGQRLEARLRQV